MAEKYRTTPVPHPGYPPGIPFIVGNEAAERFSFYGMKVLLTFYFIHVLKFNERESAEHVHHFNVAVYFLPLFGAFIADRYWGKYKTIVRLSVVYCLGHLVLSLFEEHRWGAFWGLTLIAVGAGGIKPCVSAHVGDQFAKGEEKKLEKIFSLFYFMINFGAGLSQVLIPIFRNWWGYKVAFAIPGVLMGIAAFVFWLGRYRFVHVPPTGADPNSFLRVVWYALTNQSKKPEGGTWLDAARGRFPAIAVDGARAVVGVIGVFAFVAVFWALQDQMSSTWTLQAGKMNLEIIPKGTLLSEGLTISPEQVQAINPVLVMLLIPLMTFVVYPGLGKLGFEMTSLRRMSIGMLCSFVSFLMAGMLQYWIDRGENLWVGWQIPGYIVLTIAEVMVSITGLEFAYTQAPRAMKSTLMSFWLVTVAIGNYLVPIFLKFSQWITQSTGEKVVASDFFVFAGLMLVAGILFSLNAMRYRPVNFMESAEPGAGDGKTVCPMCGAAKDPSQPTCPKCGEASDSAAQASPH